MRRSPEHDGEHGVDCDAPLPGPVGTCLEPNCPCGEVVPLALIVPDHPNDEGRRPHQHHHHGGEHRCGFRIDHDGRTELPPPASFLTRIVRVNWPHGGEVTLSELRDRLGAKLTIDFDRPIKPSSNDGVGVNPFTFLVSYGGAQRDVEFLPSDPDPTLEADGRRAVYRIAPSMLRHRDNIAGNVVFITLKCDFVLDCHGHPVDGDHIGGRLPSGNGSPGGAFESWFRVVGDHRREEG
jgi:hypothetical protein